MTDLNDLLLCVTDLNSWFIFYDWVI